MHKFVLLLALLSTVICQEGRRNKIVDPFSSLDRHITHTLAYHYLWPWNQLIRAAAALDAEEALEEPEIVSDADKFEVHLNVRRFKPDELRIKVRNRYIILEGNRKETNDDIKFMANHFIQRFVLPPGSKQEEVTAILNEKGILTISVPKHMMPPPPPEREVPIEVRLSPKFDEKSEKPEDKTETTTENKEHLTSSQTPFEQLDLVEATTHVGKIRKKELKTSTKTVKDNEVTKGVDTNGLDYALIEADE